MTYKKIEVGNILEFISNSPEYTIQTLIKEGFVVNKLVEKEIYSKNNLSISMGNNPGNPRLSISDSDERFSEIRYFESGEAFTISISKRDWETEYKYQNGLQNKTDDYRYLARPRCITVKNNLPTLTYKYFTNLRSINSNPIVLFVIKVHIYDWTDFNKDLFNEELDFDSKLRLKNIHNIKVTI